MRPEPVVGKWPEGDKEHVTHCPACGGDGGALMHQGVTDNVFRCAPDIWDLVQCHTCGAGYLNPRPTAASIGRAYHSYYTHEDRGVDDIPRHGLVATARRMLRNGYMNHRYGAAFLPSSRFGIFLMSAFMARKAEIDREYRNMPRYTGKGERLLDIGCGDGAFLRRARKIGWDAVGIEPDAHAAARLTGLPVLRGALPNIPLPDASFDFVTLNHVIEHVHEPLHAMREIWRLLKPGGCVWMATPNITSLGHRIWGADWIGIQSPTHLVLFARRSIKGALLRSGFSRVNFMPMCPQAASFFGQSHRIRFGGDPFAERNAVPPAIRWCSWMADLLAAAMPRFREEIVLIAEKPKAPGQ